MAQLDLTRKLAQPINLTAGPRSHLVTLMDAAILIRDLDRFREGRTRMLKVDRDVKRVIEGRAAVVVELKRGA